MKPRHKKLAVIVASVTGLVVATLFITNAFRSNLLFFYSPSDVAAGMAPAEREFRLGGLVEKGSVKKSPDSLKMSFVVTDNKHRIKVKYEGILPDLFREGQGVVTKGSLSGNNTFVATEVLAKHDENYMPPEVADALKRAHDDATRPAPGKP